MSSYSIAIGLIALSLVMSEKVPAKTIAEVWVGVIYQERNVSWVVIKVRAKVKLRCLAPSAGVAEIEQI